MARQRLVIATTPMLVITESIAGINGFSDILKDKYDNNLTIQALAQV